MDQTRLYFVVHDFGDDPGVVTRLLGITPTHVLRRGQRRPGPNAPPAKYELWALDSTLPEAAPFDEHLASIVSQLEAAAGGMREVMARFSAHLQCHSHFSTNNPGFAIPAALVQRVAALGLGIDFDLYVLYEDEPAVPGSDAPAV